jgi:hypothetical protein
VFAAPVQPNATASPSNFERAVPLAMEETRVESGSVGSACSGRTLASSVGILGPLEVDGEVFLKVRQCPLSGVKNTDPNIIVDGSWGPSFSKNVIWNRGSSQNPLGRFERVSVLTWEHGGFADACPNIDDFCVQVKTDPSVMKQFRAAYAEMVAIVREGRMRFRGDAKGKCKLRLETAQRTVVTAYRSSQLNVKAKFRGVLKDVYEKEHPGRIEKKNLKVVKALIFRLLFWPLRSP